MGYHRHSIRRVPLCSGVRFRSAAATCALSYVCSPADYGAQELFTKQQKKTKFGTPLAPFVAPVAGPEAASMLFLRQWLRSHALPQISPGRPFNRLQAALDESEAAPLRSDDAREGPKRSHRSKIREWELGLPVPKSTASEHCTVELTSSNPAAHGLTSSSAARWEITCTFPL